MIEQRMRRKCRLKETNWRQKNVIIAGPIHELERKRVRKDITEKYIFEQWESLGNTHNKCKYNRLED